jgi:hypothetical protein
MQFDQLKRHGFTPVLCDPTTPSRPCRAPAWHDVAAENPNRRELLKTLLAVALAMVPNSHAVAGTLPLERDRFVELSEKLCAMSIDDRSLADVIQNALAAQFTDDDLRRIAELLRSDTPQETDRLVTSSELAKSIVSVWYSGLFGTGERTRVLAYEEALAWRATGYAKAPGTCGEFGDWIKQPPSALDRERRP